MESTQKKVPPSVQENIEQNKRAHDKTVRRFYVVAWLFVVAAFVVWGRLYWIGGVDGATWRKLERSHRPPKDIVEYPKRGNIYTATGELLRVSIPYYRMRFDFRADGYNELCSVNRCKEGEVLRTLADISFRNVPRLRKLDQVNTESALVQRWTVFSQKGFRGADLYGYNLTFNEYEALRSDSLMYNYNKNGKKTSRSALYRALHSDKINIRNAPNGEMAKSILGSVHDRTRDSITVAVGGIEEYYNKYIAGSFGIKEQSFRTTRSTTIQKTPPIDGCDLYTAIDWTLQDVAEKALIGQIDSFQAYRGSVAVMEVSTGRIVAISNKERDLTTNQIKEGGNSIFLDLMEPGSTLKTASMAIALDDGLISPKETIDIGLSGNWYYRGKPIQDHNRGVLTYEEALANSSNIATAKMVVFGYEEHPDVFVQKLRALGFGIHLKSDIPRPSTPVIHSPQSKGWDKLTLSRMSYGYAIQIPPIYILSFYNAIANGGRLMRPYIVDKIVSPKGEVILENKPTVLQSNIATPSTIEALQTMLRMVVTEGTAKSLRTPIVAISGKTGTARYTEPKYGYIKDEHVVSFCGYFPSENPRYTVYANIVRPQKPKGRPAAAPMAGSIVKAVAIADTQRRKQIKFDGMKGNHSTSAPRLLSGRRTSTQDFSQQVGLNLRHIEKKGTTPYVSTTLKDDTINLISITPQREEIMPSVIGMSASDAYYLLLNHGVSVRLRGRGEVKTQSKPAGSKIMKGESVTLYLTPIQRANEENRVATSTPPPNEQQR